MSCLSEAEEERVWTPPIHLLMWTVAPQISARTCAKATGLLAVHKHFFMAHSKQLQCVAMKRILELGCD